MELGLKDRRGIVVGGSKGIGRAIALELSREGVDLVIASRTQGDLEAAAAEISAETGQRVVPLVADVRDRTAVDAMVAEAVDTLGGLDILVNSGSLPGGSEDAVGPIHTIVEEAFLEDFNTKYLGALRCARAALPHLRASGQGRIVNISGLNARIAGNLSGGARNTSLVHFTRTLAQQFGRDGVTVNCIHPGLTRTERLAEAYATRAQRKGLTAAEVEAADYAPGGPRANSIGRMVDASEIAYITVFLCSNKSWAINGEVIPADGGGTNSVYY